MNNTEDPELHHDYMPVPLKRSASGEYQLLSLGDEAESVLGYSVSELLADNGEFYNNLIRADDISNIRQIFSSASSGGVLYTAGYRLTAKNGNSLNIRECSLKYSDEHEERLWEGIIFICNDKYKKLFENVPFGLYVTDIDGHIVDMNRQMMNIIGIEKKSDFYDKDIFDMYVDREFRPIWQKKTETEGQGLYSENQWKIADGNIIWIGENASLVEGFAGQQYFEVAVEDITTRKKAEKAFYETYLKLQATNEELNSRTVWMDSLNAFTFELVSNLDFDSTVEVIMKHLRQNFNYLFACTIFFNWDNTGFTVEHMDCRDNKVLQGVRLDDKMEFGMEEEMNSMLLAGRGNVLSIDFNTLIPESVGMDLYRILERLHENGLFSFVLIPLASGKEPIGQLLMGFSEQVIISGDEKYFLTGLSDYSAMAIENLRLYDKLQKSYESLQNAQSAMKKQERLNAMGRIASGITHDINNTLAPITLYTEALLETEPGLSDRARKYLGIIQNAVTDIENVTQRLRTFYKQDDDLTTEPITIAELYEELIELTRPKWETIPNKNGIVIKINPFIEDPKAEILGVRSDIRESLVNCVFNSVDAMPEGGEIKLIQKTSGKFCILAVEDNGSGMTEDQLLHCQEPFYTTKGSAGTGLGLSEVYGMMQRHDGHLEIESRPGSGTTVRLHFKKNEKKINKRAEKEVAPDLPPLRILCVDDDPLMLDSLREMLTIDGHYVETAANGKDAMAAFSSHLEKEDKFRIVITDLGMPATDGYGFASKIKKIDPKVSIILLSGWGYQIQQQDETPEFVDLVLSKPPKMKYLRTALESLIERFN